MHIILDDNNPISQIPYNLNDMEFGFWLKFGQNNFWK